MPRHILFEIVRHCFSCVSVFECGLVGDVLALSKVSSALVREQVQTREGRRGGGRGNEEEAEEAGGRRGGKGR